MTAKKNMKPKCYTYIRVSTEMQVDGYSLDAQKERLAKYAEYQGMEIVREYCDAGKSGKSISGRPEFSQMLQDVSAERDGVEYILVFKLSRFGRNAADVLNSLQLIQDFGVNLICVEDGIDSSKESGKLTITVLSAVAEIERENILVQTMEGRKQKAREGKWNGGLAPYGYHLDKETGTLVVDADEAEIVRKIYDLFVNSDMGTAAIADYLNDHAYIKNRSRDFEVCHFTQALIMKILDNPVYIGKIAYGRTKTEKIRGTRNEVHRVPSGDFILADGIHDAIIDSDLWEAARRKRSETGLRWVKTYNLEREHLLSGLVRCPVCGSGMTGMFNRHRSRKNGEVKDVFYYRCLHRKVMENGRKCDFNHAYRQDQLNAEVEQIVLGMILDKDFCSIIQSKIEQKIDMSSLENERDNLREQMRQVEVSKSKLIDQMDRLDVSDRHYNRKYQDMQGRLDSMYERISNLENAIENVTGKIVASSNEQLSVKNLYKVLLDFGKVYKRMSDAERKQFYRSIIKSIEVFPEETSEKRVLKHIDFKFPLYMEPEEEQKMLRKLNDVETVVLMSRI